MLMLPPSVRIFMARDATDMRKSFDGLSAMISSMDLDPLSGHLFVFFNKRRDRVKILYWDRSGYWLLYKRLEHGTFTWSTRTANSNGSIEVSSKDLALLLEGVDMRRASRRLTHDELLKGPNKY
jgi:transposase